MSDLPLALIPSSLQGVAMSDEHIARAAGLARQTNDKTREAADARMRFEDEPGQYYALLDAHTAVS